MIQVLPFRKGCIDMGKGERDKSITIYESLNVQPIDVIRGVLPKEGLRGFYKGNIIKYFMRAGSKGEAVEDLKKAKDYLCWLIETYEGVIKNENDTDKILD